MSGKLGCVGENGGGPRLKLARVVIVRSLEDGLRSEILLRKLLSASVIGHDSVRRNI